MWSTFASVLEEFESTRILLYIIITTFVVIGRFDTKALKAEISELRRDHYKSSFYNESLPVYERLDYGHRYIELGGNSRTSAEVKALAREHADDWLTIQKKRGTI